MLKNEIIFSNKNFPREFEPKDWFKNVDNVPFFFFFFYPYSCSVFESF